MEYLGINLIKDRQGTANITKLQRYKKSYIEEYIMFLNEKTQFHRDVSYPKLVYIFNVKNNPNLALQGS